MSPIASFSPNLPENRRFYSMQEGSRSHMLPSPPNAEEFAFMQGVHDNMAIVDLSPAQMGVLLTFVPPSSSYVLDPYALNKLRKSMSVVVKVLAHDYTGKVHPLAFYIFPKSSLKERKQCIRCNFILYIIFLILGVRPKY